MVFSIFSKAYFKSTTTTMPKRMTKKEKEEKRWFREAMAKRTIFYKYEEGEKKDFVESLTDEERADKELFFKKLEKHTYYSFMVLESELNADWDSKPDTLKTLEEDKELLWEEFGVA